MALGPNRQVFQTTIRYAVNAAAERGGILSAHTSTAGVATYLTTPTGASIYPIGILLDDIEDMNYDRHPEYLQREVVDIGSVVGIANKGEFQTNLIVGSPSQGQPAYLHPSGYIGATRLTDGINPAPQVGKFRTALDANGFATVLVDL
jgi:hypothetical protein